MTRPSLEPVKDDVPALVLGDGPDSRLQKFLDLPGYFADFAIGSDGRRGFRFGRPIEKDRTLGHEVVHDDTQYRRFQQCPILAVLLGQRDRIGAEVRPAQFADLEQSFDERGTPHVIATLERHGSEFEDRDARNEAKFRCILGFFGLYEHAESLASSRSDRENVPGTNGIKNLQRIAPNSAQAYRRRAGLRSLRSSEPPQRRRCHGPRPTWHPRVSFPASRTAPWS